MKRLFLLLFTIICTAVCLAQERFTIGDLTYEVIDSNRVEVDRCSISATAVVIPDSVQLDGKTYTVSRIGEYAFSHLNRLVSVHIPGTVTSIGNWAFNSSRNLYSITIPNSVDSIGIYAFDLVYNVIYNGAAVGSPWGASNMNGYVEDGFVYVDSTKTILLKYIGIDTSIIISKSVTRIEKEAFISCKFTSISIPETVKSIRMGAFAFCRNLTSVSLPNGIDTISPYLFYDCSGLTSVSIPNSVTTICENAFSLCSNLDSIVVPSSVKEIAPYTFNGCENLVFIDIPNSVTFIGNAAFYGCISMSTIIIPNSVTSIGNSAFGLVKNIVYQGSAKGSPWEALCVKGFVEDEFVYYDSTKAVLAGYVGKDSNVVIDNSVTSIAEAAFLGNDRLTSISIPYGVTSIGNRAFFNCDCLTMINVPNSVTSIGEEAFSYCDSLTSVIIPDGVTTIGDYAFSVCRNLSSFTISSTVVSIGKSVFSDCESLKELISYATNPPTIADKVFKYIPNATTLQVPRGSLERYKVSDWNKYFEGRIVEIEE